MKQKIIKRVCIEDSAYSLFLYFLISTKDEIVSTFYFFSDGIPEAVRSFFAENSHYFNSCYKRKSNYSLNKLLFLIFLNAVARYRWPFLKKANLYGLDICFFSGALVGNRKMISIEDGLSNYFVVNKRQRFRFLKSLLCGPLAFEEYPGRNMKHIEKVILTGLKKEGLPKDIPVEFINIEKEWNNSSQEKKKFIMKIYDVTQEDIVQLQSRSELLLTQTYSEDKYMTEKEKIDIYKKMLEGVDLNRIIIKPHPRETTDYLHYFPESFVFQKKIPMQLITLLGVKFERVYTICSTAAFSFPYDLDIVFLGSDCHPEIKRRCGVVSKP